MFAADPRLEAETKGNVREALQYFGIALRCAIHEYGEIHYATASTYSCMATVFEGKCAYQVALMYHEKALSVRLMVRY